MRLQLVVGAMMLAGAVASAQTGTVSGTVLDRSTRKPVENAMVAVAGTSAMTRPNGTYTIIGVPPGTYTMEVRRSGYRIARAQSVTITSDARRTQDFQLDWASEVPPPASAPTMERGVVGGTPPTTMPPMQIRPPRVEAGTVTPPPSTMTPPRTAPTTMTPPPAGYPGAPHMEPGMAMPHPPEPGQGMPSFENMLFPPELVMQQQRALELTSEQRRVITEAVKALQNQTIDLQWNLQAEQQALVALLEKKPINEQAAVAQMSKLVDLEDAVKRTHLATLIKIKNALTDKQIGILNSVRHQYPEYPPPPERRDWEASPELNDWIFTAPPAFSPDLRDWKFPPPSTRRQQQY